MTTIRVPRGRAKPDEAELRAALERDRAQLHLPPEACPRDVVVAGPYAILVNGQDLDEYVVWER